MEPFPPLIAVHAVCALTVLALTPLQIFRRRRDRVHRLLGRSWVGAMVLTCLTSFAIMPHGFSWLHGLALWTLVSITLGILAIRRGNVPVHRANMIGSSIGITIAFAFAVLIPERLIPQLLRHEPVVALGTLLAILTLVAIWSTVVLRTSPPSARREGQAVASMRRAPSRASAARRDSERKYFLR